jgi:hypothetical protein
MITDAYKTRPVYDAAAMRSADAIAIMFTVMDDPNAGEALRAALCKSQGYRVLCAATGQPVTPVGQVDGCVLS